VCQLRDRVPVLRTRCSPPANLGSILSASAGVACRDSGLMAAVGMGLTNFTERACRRVNSPPDIASGRRRPSTL